MSRTRGRSAARCHPDREMHAGGLCNSCYARLRGRGIRKPSLEVMPAEDLQPHCDMCGRTDVPLVFFSLINSVRLSASSWSHRASGRIRLCQRCWKPLQVRPYRGMRRRPVRVAA